MDIKILFVLVCPSINCLKSVPENYDIQNLVKQIAEMKDTMGNQESRIKELEHIVVDQTMEIRYLKNDISRLKPNVHALQTGLTGLKEILKRHKSSVMETRETEDPRLDKNVTSDGSRILCQSVQTEESKTIQVRESTQPIAFYAYLSTRMTHPGKTQTVIFDEDKTNFGNGYNKYTGVFTAPTSGLYVFTSSIAMDGSDEYASYEIMKNAEVQGTFFVDAECNDCYQYSSTTVVFLLEQGDSVFVRIGNNFGVRGSVFSTAYAHSSFAGWQLH